MLLRELQIELAGVCNIACTYCTWQDRVTGKGLMERKLAHRLLDEVIAMKNRPLLTLHGVGEPTLHPDLMYILGKARFYALPIRLSTNCIKIDAYFIDMVRQMDNLMLSLALHQGVPMKTRLRAEEHALDYLSTKPENRAVEILIVCDHLGSPAAARIVEKFLPLIERMPNARINLKQPQTWPRSPPIKGHIPGPPDVPIHPQVFIDTVQTPRSLGRDCHMPEYLMNVQTDGTVSLCCVGEEDWKLPKIQDTTIEELWNSAHVVSARQKFYEKNDDLPCGHCQKRTDC